MRPLNPHVVGSLAPDRGVLCSSIYRGASDVYARRPPPCFLPPFSLATCTYILACVVAYPPVPDCPSMEWSWSSLPLWHAFSPQRVDRGARLTRPTNRAGAGICSGLQRPAPQHGPHRLSRPQRAPVPSSRTGACAVIRATMGITVWMIPLKQVHRL